MSEKKESVEAGLWQVAAGALAKLRGLGKGSDSSQEPGWRLGIRTALRRFAYVAVFVVIWVCLSYFSILPRNYLVNGTFALSILLFLLAFPCSVIFKLDSLMQDWGFEEQYEVALLVALSLVFINFLVIGAFRGWTKGLRQAKDK